MFSGSFQYHFLHLSIGTKPEKGQNEARSLVLDRERRYEGLLCMKTLFIIPDRHSQREGERERAQCFVI